MDKDKKSGFFAEPLITRREQKNKNTAISRPSGEINLRERPDRITKYLRKYLDKFIFDEFSNEYLKENNIYDIMNGISIPLRKEDIEEFKSKKGLSVFTIGENMAWVIGIDPKFKYTQNYVDYMSHLFQKNVVKTLTKEAKDEGERENLDSACIHFRAALCFDPTDLAAMYGYARSCREMYLRGGSAEYVGDLKAEAIEYFELLTEIHPRFAEAHYYLGYAYLNLGLYRKAFLVWQDFVKKSKHPQDKKEIQKRLKQLAVPLEIESGYNAVLAQRWDEGIQILEPYLEGAYKDWWPLHYYLGVAYISTDRRRDAVERFENALRLNPSHIETMEELVHIYTVDSNSTMVKKYRDKVDLLKKGGYTETSEAKSISQSYDYKEPKIKEKSKERPEEKSVKKRIKRLDSK